MDDDTERKKDKGGAELLLNLLDKGRRTTLMQERKVLEYNNKDPESVLEQFMLPKERIQKKGENPESDDVEL